MENLKTLAESLKATQDSGMASESEKALISSLAKKKQEAIADVIEENVKKKEEEEEKAQATAAASQVIRMSAAVGSNTINSPSRFPRGSVYRGASRFSAVPRYTGSVR